MGSSPDERLSHLESSLMHVEKLYEQLNEVVIEQQDQIERLTRELGTLREALASEEGGEETPPPHY